MTRSPEREVFALVSNCPTFACSLTITVKIAGYLTGQSTRHMIKGFFIQALVMLSAHSEYELLT